MSLSRFDLPTAPLGEGTVLLEASAGTGKTYALTGIVLRLLLEGAIERLDQALVVTFTIAATDELKNRLRQGLVRAAAVCDGAPDRDAFFAGLARHGSKGARILRQALDDFDQVAIATMHGFCRRLLDDAAFESHEPFQLEFAADEAPLWQRAAEDALRLLRAHDSLVLGALLQETRLDPDALVQIYRLWQRNPDVQLDPAEPHLDVHLSNLRSALHGAASLWEPALAERIAGFQWTKAHRPFPDEAAFALTQVQETLGAAPELALGLLRELAPVRLRRTTHRRSPPRVDHPFFAACDAVETHCALAMSHLRSELLLHMHARLERHKRAEAVLSFQDLLARTHAALHDPARRASLLQTVRQRHRVALIDEFQDTDSLQYGIFSTCFQNRPLFLVGDPKQSIYAFRGADLRTYLDARDDAVQHATLDTNFRSSVELVTAIGQLFAAKNAFVEPGIRAPSVRAAAAPGALQLRGDAGPALRWRFVPAPAEKYGGHHLLPADLAEPRIAADVAAEISRLLRAGITLDAPAERPLQPRDIAVLTRTNRQAITIQDTLRAAGIVSAIGKAGDVFASDELVELERVLLAILLPQDVTRARAAMSTRLWGHDAGSLQTLDGDEQSLDRELAQLDGWRQLWLRSGFVVMKEQMLADLGAERRLLAIAGGERRLTNFQQLFEMLHEAEHEHRLSPEGLLQWLQHERRHQDEVDYQRRELRLESDDDAVQILTVHGSKGLQYEVVFCPFLWNGRRAPQGRAVVQRGANRQLAFEVERDDEAWQLSEGDRLAEDVRLCYVAVTRARRRCYVHWGALGHNNGGAWLSALGWLLRPTPPDTTNAGWQLAWAEACKGDAPRFGEQLQAFVQRSRGTMDAADVPARPEAVPVPPAAPPATHSARVVTRRQRQRALHSFSSLTAGAAPSDALRDVADPPHEPALPAEAPDAGTGIFGFQRGAVAGQCLHTVLEHVDWNALDEDRTQQLVAATLRQFALAEPEAHPGLVDPVRDVLGNLRDLAAARVHAGGPDLAALCQRARQAEWQFMLPTRSTDLRQLANVFAAHGGVAADYAPRLRTLPNRTLRGFLTGFADLVAEHEQRYWIVDWKSNHLGNRLEDYGPESLSLAMRQHDYVLQYHLYALALHRHLRARLRDYAPDRHFGGVCYVFLRGARPGHDDGMFFDRPAAALLEDMDRWAAGAGSRR
ncbi:MAG TPA: exodeoxyribonuclease V subunit beta [Planctomycetota bacterium]|nr:exodeoxyribonuclease V subunit beta [Planctomycetota bacterium]